MPPVLGDTKENDHGVSNTTGARYGGSRERKTSSESGNGSIHPTQASGLAVARIKPKFTMGCVGNRHVDVAWSRNLRSSNTSAQKFRLVKDSGERERAAVKVRSGGPDAPSRTYGEQG